MDYISHGLWSYIFFHRIHRPILAVCFGLLPDTMSWVIYAIYRAFTYETFGKPVLSQIPGWTYTLYNLSHSLIVASFVIIFIFIILRRIPLYVFAWPIAIVMDALTHSREFLPTPFLWPVSSWTFPGISWATPWFFILNYILIAAALILIFYRRWKAKLNGLRQN